MSLLPLAFDQNDAGQAMPSAGQVTGPDVSSGANLNSARGSGLGEVQQIMDVGEKDPKLSSDLVKLAKAEDQARLNGRELSAQSSDQLPEGLRAVVEARLLRLDDEGHIQVYVYPNASMEAAASAVEAVGGNIERSDSKAGIVQAHVPISALQALSEDASARFIRLPDYAFREAGTATTQGDSILKANLARSSFGVDGAGVRVGVISDGLEGLATSQSSGDLPFVDYNTCNMVPQSPTSAGAGAEGTAMLEIVHDMAPGAELWFGHFGLGFTGTALDFNAAVDCLAANTDVVVDDVAFFNIGPYDGTSFVSANTSAELNSTKGIRAYANAVGNEAFSHYQEAYTQFSPSSTLHRFSATATTGDALAIGPTFADPLLLQAGGIVVLRLQWNDPFGSSSNDYDLGLFRDSTGELVASSTNAQTGSQDPTEQLVFLNNGGTAYFDIGINRFSGAPRTFDMFITCFGCVPLPSGIFGQPIHNFNTSSSSVPANSDAGGGVITAGAINAADPGNDDIASYSSRGPTNDGRTKPDISGIDGVSVTGAGGFGSPFYGTSAAAPHIGAIAALVLACQPQLKSGEPGDNPAADRTAVRNTLLNSGADLGAGGVDNVYGAGRADALGACSCVDAPSSGPAPPGSPAYYHPVTPTRILDTRTGLGGFPSRVGQGCHASVQVTGVGGVPASGVSAVVINTTVTEVSAGSYLTVYPSGVARPLASNLNFAAGQTVPNLVTVKVGAGGKVDVFNAVGQTHVIFDVVGWYGDTPDASPFTPSPTPTRSASPTATATRTASPTATATATASPSATPTPSPIATAAASDTATPPGSGSATPTATDTLAPTPTATATATPTPTASATATPTAAPTPTPVGYGYYHPLPPSRVMDTRTGIQGISGKVQTNATVDVPVTNIGGVPAVSSGVTTVVLNVTVTDGTAGSYLTVYPSNAPQPLASNLNFGPGQTVPNLVIVKVGPDGKVKLYNCCGQVHVIFDVVGWFGPLGTDGRLFRSLSPARIMDTRISLGWLGALGHNGTATVTVTNIGGVPAGAKAIVVNATVTQPTAGSYLTVYPSDASQPTASNLNFGPGQTVPNLVMVKVGADGNVKIYNAIGQVHVILDVVGYFE